MATILLAEDDDILRQVLLQALSRAGHQALGAKSGAEALVLDDDLETLDLIITDLRLKDMNGIEVAERLRERFPGLPTLVISGADRIEEDLPQFPSAFLPKPFTPGQLASALGALIPEDGPAGTVGKTRAPRRDRAGWLA